MFAAYISPISTLILGHSLVTVAPRPRQSLYFRTGNNKPIHTIDFLCLYLFEKEIKHDSFLFSFFLQSPVSTPQHIQARQQMYPRLPTLHRFSLQTPFPRDKMAPHTRFKLAVIRTMRCDFCNKGNVNGLQECQDCNMHFCRECIENGMLNKDEKHRMQQNAIDNLDWDKPAKGRRAANRRETTTSQPVSHDALSKEQRREARRAERHVRHEARHSGTHHESAPQFQSPQGPSIQPHMGAFPGSGFNIPAGNHEQAGHGHFQYVSAPPGYPPGYGPSLPNNGMPYGVPPSGPGQFYQQPRQGGGLAMPFGPMYGNNMPPHPGMPPRGDPRFNTPPGPQFAHSGYPVPNNFGGYYGGHPLGYTPAPTPPGFPGPGFHQPPSQPQPMYNDRGYVSRGNMPTGQPVMGPGPASGQPYGGGPFPHGPPSVVQFRPRRQEGEKARGEQIPGSAEHTPEARACEPTPQGHFEQPVNSLTIQRQQQQQAWEREQVRQTWEQEQAREMWERQKAQQVMQQIWEQSQRQSIQQNAQHMAQQEQPQVKGGHQTQPAVEQASQTAQQAHKQDEQRQEHVGEQKSQQQAARPISEGDAVSGPPPITSPPFTLPSIVAPHVTASLITLPPITALPTTSTSFTTPPIAALSLQEARPPVSAPAPTPIPRPSDPEPDTTSQSPRPQQSETVIVPTVVEHVQRPFGIPALARDLYAGRPNYYDETAARWAQSRSQPVRTRAIREYDEDDYDDSNDDNDEDATDIDPANPGWPPYRRPPPSSRGHKRAHSEVSSIDSTLSAELDQPVAGAVVQPGTEALRRELRDNEDIARVLREEGERAALDMAAAANTLQGAGRGLGGVGDARCMANDVVISRRQEELDRELRREEERRAVEPVRKKPRRGGGGGDDIPGGVVGRV